MIPKEKVEAIVSKHKSIEKELSSGDVDPKKYVEMSKGLWPKQKQLVESHVE